MQAVFSQILSLDEFGGIPLAPTVFINNLEAKGRITCRWDDRGSLPPQHQNDGAHFCALTITGVLDPRLNQLHNDSEQNLGPYLGSESQKQGARNRAAFNALCGLGIPRDWIYYNPTPESNN